MAKSDLLKEAIADAKAVKETAIANAKIALQEAFAPRIQSMLGAKLAEQLDDEEEMEPGMEDMAAEPEMEPGMEDEMEPEMEDEMDAGGVNVTIDDPATEISPDYEGQVAPAVADDEMPADMDTEMPADDIDAGDELESAEDDMMDAELEEIIRELEEGMYSEEEEGEMVAEEEVVEQVKDEAADDGDGFLPENANSDIDSIIEAILAEEEDEMDAEEDPAGEDAVKAESVELTEAYKTIEHLRSVINEVNLLNAKLLYTNKLFRNYELNEAQKMKVIENFDRAGTTREVKLVFSTLAESLKKPATKRRVVKESYASKPTTSTAPSQETKTQILSEGTELADRWKKLAGLN